MTVLLDSGPLGLVTNPKLSVEAQSCRNWLSSLLEAGASVIVPEIADYEIRRELLRAEKIAGLRRLDLLVSQLDYLPLTTAVMHRAAALWADARRRGRATADPQALDGDAILAAQALSLDLADDQIVIATTNVGHLAQFAPAKLWRDI